MNNDIQYDLKVINAIIQSLPEEVKTKLSPKILSIDSIRKDVGLSIYIVKNKDDITPYTIKFSFSRENKIHNRNIDIQSEWRACHDQIYEEVRLIDLLEYYMRHYIKNININSVFKFTNFSKKDKTKLSNTVFKEKIIDPELSDGYDSEEELIDIQPLKMVRKTR